MKLFLMRGVVRGVGQSEWVDWGIVCDNILPGHIETFLAVARYFVHCSSLVHLQFEINIGLIQVKQTRFERSQNREAFTSKASKSKADWKVWIWTFYLLISSEKMKYFFFKFMYLWRKAQWLSCKYIQHYPLEAT